MSRGVRFESRGGLVDRAARALTRGPLSTAEVAAVLEISEPTVRVHLHRAVQALRKVLKP